MTESKTLDQVLLRYLTIEPQRETLRFCYQNEVLDAIGNPFSDDCFRSFWWGLQHRKPLGLILKGGIVHSTVIPQISTPVFHTVTHTKVLDSSYTYAELITAKRFTVNSTVEWLKMEHTSGQVKVWLRFRRRKKPIALAVSPGFRPTDSLREAIHRRIPITCYGYRLRGEKLINGFF